MNRTFSDSLALAQQLGVWMRLGQIYLQVALLVVALWGVATRAWAGGESAAAAAAANDAQGTTDVDSARSWLTRMDEAVLGANYDGVFTYMNGDRMSSMHIVHAVIDGVTHERLIHLDGLEREIIRIGDSVSCILNPDDEMVELGETVPTGPFARAFSRNFGQVPATYEVKVTGRNRIAGREAQLLAIMPKDSHRFGYQLWLDVETALLLRSELVPSEGHKALEVYSFGTIAIGQNIAAQSFNIDPVRKVVHQLVAAPAVPRPSTTPAKWTTAWLPEGFVMTAMDHPQSPATQQGVETLMYSDGLASLSVFVEAVPAASTRDEPDVMRQGATVAVSLNHVDDDGHAHLITVVGEVPDQTAIAIAESVRPL